MTFDDRGLARDIRAGSQMAAGRDKTAPGSSLEARALRLHQLSRQRSNHFHMPVMADHAMDIMLSLMIGELQRIDISVDSLLLANGLSIVDGDTLLDRLIQAGLVSFGSHQVEERRRVILTPLGSARMQSYISTYPDV